MFCSTTTASAKAINVHNGHMLWTQDRHAGRRLAGDRRQARLVLMPVLSISGHSPGNGRFVALSMKTGKVVWSRPLAARQRVLADRLRARPSTSAIRAATCTRCNVANGHLNWTYHASGADQGRPGARRTASCTSATTPAGPTRCNAVNGHQVWAVSTNGAHFGFGSGNFYSTPAVAFGRVYMGNTDGRVYSFGARNGALAWATTTGAYVYASAAVANPQGSARRSTSAPTTATSMPSTPSRARCAGGTRRAARSRARRRSSATSSTTPTSARRRPPGSNVRTGRQVFSFPDGAFNPVIADDRAIYLTATHASTRCCRAQPRPHARSAPPRHRKAPTPETRRARSTTGGARATNRKRRQDAAERAPLKAQQRATRCASPEAPNLDASDRTPCYNIASMRCRSGSHCQQPAEKGRRFCAEHAAELDRMREELKDAAAARIGRGRPKRSSTCCRPGCYEPRVPPAAYCDTCAAAGYVEEAA